MGALRIYLNTPTASRKGLRYDVRLSRADGDLIITGSIQPLTDAARFLYEKGARGRLEAWDNVRPYPRMWGRIERLAQLTAIDPDNGNLAFARWKPHPLAPEARKSPPEPAEVSRHPRSKHPPTFGPPVATGGRVMTLSNSLADIAEQVKTFAIAADASQRAAIDGMLSAGRLLNEAKEKCAHGEWAGFLDRAGIHERTARRYMQLARSGLKSDTVAEMGGLKAALEHLAKIELFRCNLPSGNDTLLATLPEDRSPLALIWADEARPGYFLAASVDLQSNSVACTRTPVRAERVTLANGSFRNALWETLDQLLERRAGDAEFQIVTDMVGLRDTLIDHSGGVVI